MKRWLTPLFLALLVAALHHWRDDVKQHLLGQSKAREAEDLRQEEAAWVFRHGPSADSSRQAQALLKSKHLIRRHRQQDAGFQAEASTALQEAVAAEMTAWKRQWPNDEERQTRLRAQGLTEAGMEQRIREALLNEAWIRQKISPDIQVTEAELKTAFQNQRQAMAMPETFRVAHLFLSRHGKDAKDRAPLLNTLRQRLSQGEKWAELVAAHSEDPRTKPLAGDLGWMTDRRMPADFMSAVRKLKKGETSGPVSTALGWHLIRLLDRRPARELSLAEAREELRATLEDKKRTAALTELEQRLTAP